MQKVSIDKKLIFFLAATEFVLYTNFSVSLIKREITNYQTVFTTFPGHSVNSGDAYMMEDTCWMIYCIVLIYLFRKRVDI